jgi:formylmethanofuran dehydrogenase subunit E
MEYPKFFDEVEKFILQDKLAEFLGATKDGIIEINYIDCVKLAGHSCPTVAGSYILAKVALQKLFEENTLPQRAMVEISFKEPKTSGVTGVIASVLGFILGAFDEGGFSGIAGKFNRKNLISFDNRQTAMVEFKRIDNEKKIALDLDTSIVPADPKMKILMQKALQGEASKKELVQFQELWQTRVEYMLLNKQIWNQIAKEI